MARIWGSGFELNSTTAGMEWTAIGSTPSIQTGTVRSGTYALESTSANVTRKGLLYQFASAAGAGPYYFRSYIRYHTLPTNATTIMGFLVGASISSTNQGIKLTSAGKLQLFNNGAQIGSDSSALSADTWYCTEMKYDFTGGIGAGILSARIDLGADFAITTTANLTNPSAIIVGTNLNVETDTTGDVFFDDIALNDNTGSFQTSYPGSGKIIHLRPSAAGDSTGWSPLAGTNWSNVSEVTPDDLTSYVNTSTVNAEDLYNVDNSNIGASDTVNVVAVGVRTRGSSSNTPTYKLEIEKTASGTKSQSAGITPGSTSFFTNAPSATNPHNYLLTTYQDPDSAAWTQATLDTMQIGAIEAPDANSNVYISTIWALVDYTPVVSTSPIGKDMGNLQNTLGAVIQQSLNRGGTY